MAMRQTDLKWVLSNNEVSKEKSQAEVRDAWDTGLALDVGESLAMRAQVSRLLASWDAARLQVNQEETAKAENRVSQMGMATPTLGHTSCAQRIRISSD
eukprot:4380964-Karenia_brevis.AAC.1